MSVSDFLIRPGNPVMRLGFLSNIVFNVTSFEYYQGRGLLKSYLRRDESGLFIGIFFAQLRKSVHSIVLIFSQNLILCLFYAAYNETFCVLRFAELWTSKMNEDSERFIWLYDYESCLCCSSTYFLLVFTQFSLIHENCVPLSILLNVM